VVARPEDAVAIEKEDLEHIVSWLPNSAVKHQAAQIKPYIIFG